jgi:hypothetical protein
LEWKREVTAMSKEEMLEELELDFSSDEAARESMKQYIRENFSDVLGDRIELLDAPNGLELLLQEVEQLKAEAGIGRSEPAKVA